MNGELDSHCATLAVDLKSHPGVLERPMKCRADYKRQARIHKALANETRLMVIDRLSRGECTVGALTKMVGLDQSTVSKHLSVLLAAGIVENRKDGAAVYYRLITPCVLDMFTCTTQVLKTRQG